MSRLWSDQEKLSFPASTYPKAATAASALVSKGSKCEFDQWAADLSPHGNLTPSSPFTASDYSTDKSMSEGRADVSLLTRAASIWCALLCEAGADVSV